MLTSSHCEINTHKSMPIAHAHGKNSRMKKRNWRQSDEKNIKIYAISTCMTWSLVLMLVLLLLLWNIFSLLKLNSSYRSHYSILQTPTALCNRQFEDCCLCVCMCASVHRAIFIASTGEKRKRLRERESVWDVHEWLIIITMMLAVVMMVDDTHKALCTRLSKASHFKRVHMQMLI